MPINFQIQPSFSAGELSPTLYSRVDMAKYKIGLALAKNVCVDYRGGVFNRPGTQWIGQTRALGAQLIPFQFNTTQAYVLEFSNLAMRVMRDDAYVTETGLVTTAITQANPGVVTIVGHGFATGDWVHLAGIGGMTQLNGRDVIVVVLSANTFSMQITQGGVAINTTGYSAFTAGGTAARIYTLTTPYITADIPNLKYTQSADVMTITHPSYAPRDLSRTGHAAWALSVISFNASIAGPTGITFQSAAAAGASWYIWMITSIDASGQESLGSILFQTASTVEITVAGSAFYLTWTPVAGAVSYIVYRSRAMFWVGGAAGLVPQQDYGFVGVSQAPAFADVVTIPDFTKTPPLGRNPFAPGAITAVVPNAIGATYSPLTALDSTTAIVDATGTGAVVRAIVSVIGGIAGVRGYEIIKGGQNYTAPAITVNTATGAGATNVVTLAPATGLYPITVTYYQQRKVFGGANSYPNTLWMTRPGSFQNMDTSAVSQENDALILPLVSDQVNAINNMVSVSSGLLVFTSYGIWLVNGGQVGAAVTPSQVQANAQDYGGATDILPLKVLYEVLYIQAKGNVVRNLAFNFQTNVFQGNDLTIFSNHFFTGFTTVRWTYADSPWKIVHAVRSDGALLTMTYLQEQQIFGWCKSETEGLFKSVVSITQANIDAVYFIVQRSVLGQTVEYVEKLASRTLNAPSGLDSRANGWFFDSALRYFGGAVTVVSGLWHLEGKTVGILADGVAQAAQAVAGGSVTIPASTTVLVGFPYQAQIQTLPLEAGASTSQGKRKDIVAFTIRIIDTFGLKIGYVSVSGNILQAWKTDVQNFNGTIKINAGVNSTLYTGDLRRTVGQGWNEQAQLLLQMDEPYSVHLTGIIPEFSLGDAKIKQKGEKGEKDD